MQRVRPSQETIRFGAFDVDLRAGELRKQGAKIKLQEQPFQIPQILLEHPGDVVTREELQERLRSAMDLSFFWRETQCGIPFAPTPGFRTCSAASDCRNRGDLSPTWVC
jgi:hypothetical protein